MHNNNINIVYIVICCSNKNSLTNDKYLQKSLFQSHKHILTNISEYFLE
jgi:hypothetical protein